MEQWPILQRFWARALHPDLVIQADGHIDRWQEEVRFLQDLGIAIEAALQFLYFQKPELEAFRLWLLENTKVSYQTHEPVTENVLSADDLVFWEANGYLILKNAIPKNQCVDAQQAIWEFLHATAEDAFSWYQAHEGRAGLMLRFFDHPALDINRQSLRIRQAYEQLYGTTAIYKTIDKVSFNPPEKDDFRFMGAGLHWDVSLIPPISFRLQGLLYLTDCAPDDGAFHCVPGFHHEIDHWLQTLPAGADPRQLVSQVLKPVAVPADAGDFVIWHQALPHCATPNHGKMPRMVQYLTYLPEAYEERKEWL